MKSLLSTGDRLRLPMLNGPTHWNYKKLLENKIEYF